MCVKEREREHERMSERLKGCATHYEEFQSDVDVGVGADVDVNVNGVPSHATLF